MAVRVFMHKALAKRTESQVDTTWKPLLLATVLGTPFGQALCVLALTCTHFGLDKICTEVYASFSLFGHPTQVNASWVTSINLLLANEIQEKSTLKWFFLRLACTCEETCLSVWPLNASVYSISTCHYLRLLKSPFGQGLRDHRIYWIPYWQTIRISVHKGKFPKFYYGRLILERIISRFWTTVPDNLLEFSLRKLYTSKNIKTILEIFETCFKTFLIFTPIIPDPLLRTISTHKAQGSLFNWTRFLELEQKFGTRCLLH